MIGTVPRIVRPKPPLPLSVAIATRVFSSELLVGLIHYYQDHPRSSTADAAREFEIGQSLVNNNISILVQAAVLTVETPTEDRRGRHYSVDQERLRHLVDSLRTYTHGEPDDAPQAPSDGQ